MKFIFPQNYQFSSKLFGVIDYSTAIFNLICWIIFFTLGNLLFQSLTWKITFFIIFCFPIFLISIIGFHHENILYVFHYLFLYYKRQKVYLYQK